MKNLLVVIFMGGLSAAVGHAAGPDDILGTWLTPNGESKIEIAKCGELYCGKIAWMQSPKNDIHNSDPSLKGRPLAGVRVVDGFKFESGSTWSGGKLYAVERGQMVTAKLVLSTPDSLDIKVSMGVAKKTVTWTRVK